MTSLTVRQKKAWEEDVSPILKRHHIPINIASWEVHYYEEVRPGRGCAINATFVDGESFAQVLMDVYGYPNVSVAQLEWVHVDVDEELICDGCKEISGEEK